MKAPNRAHLESAVAAATYLDMTAVYPLYEQAYMATVGNALVDIAITLHELVDQLDDLNAHLEER